MSDSAIYKVVVVEDEQIILQDIISEIEGTVYGFKVVGTAFNGRDALDVIHSLKPDVLFTDIRMPIMDGLELIKQVKDIFPNMHIVILSGYGEFKYAQLAIKLGVNDYLLKPLDTHSLLELLEKFKKSIDDKNSDTEKKILSSTVEGLSTDNCFPSSLGSKNFTLFLICIGHLGNHINSSGFSSVISDIWSQINWSAILPDIFYRSKKWWVIDEKLMNLKFLIVCSDELSGDDITLAAYRLKDTLRKYSAPFPVNICIENSWIEYTDIQKLAQKLRIAMDTKLVMGRSDVFFTDINILPDDIRPLDTKTQNTLLAIIESGNRQLIKQEIFSLFNKWIEKDYSQRIVEKSLNQLLRLIQSSSMSVSEAEITHMEYSISVKLAISHSFYSIFEDIWTIFKGILAPEYAEDIHQKDLVDKICEFIESHFTEPLTLEEIAKKFSFNGTYLTRVFKRYKGETPVKYLISLRIKEAQRMIETQPELDLNKIGKVVGYPDSHYFSRIFKQVSGLSPSEYKDKITKQTINKSLIE